MNISENKLEHESIFDQEDVFERDIEECSEDPFLNDLEYLGDE